MRTAWRRFEIFKRDTRGTVAVTFGMSAVALMMVGGLAVDYGIMTRHAGSLQTAADAAAVAAAREIPLSNAKASQIEAAAKSIVEANLPSTGMPVVNTSFDPNENKVVVSLEYHWTPFFAHFFSSGITPISASAEARIVGSGSICMLGLDDSANKTVHLKKNAALDASGCGVFSNSTHKHSITVDDNASLVSSMTCSAGGKKAKKHSSFTPEPTLDCPPLPDPLAARPAPAVGSCEFNDLEIRDEVRTLKPGVYCGGLKIKGNAHVKLDPGIYIIKDDKLEVTDDATFEGENVGFYLAGSKAKLTFKKQTTINLTAPADGPMAGILIFEDRTASKIEKHEITSDNARLLLGTIYLANGTLKIDSEGPVADKSAYTAIIARTIELDEGPTLYLNSDYKATNIPVPRGLIGGQVFLTR